jgi:hypothetical protein
MVGMSWWRHAGAMTPMPATYPGYRFPAEITHHATWLYHLFSLSLRDIELILAERGCDPARRFRHERCLEENTRAPARRRHGTRAKAQTPARLREADPPRALPEQPLALRCWLHCGDEIVDAVARQCPAYGDDVVPRLVPPASKREGHGGDRQDVGVGVRAGSGLHTRLDSLVEPAEAQQRHGARRACRTASGQRG